MTQKSAQEYVKQPYARILIPDEQGGYSAEILEFPGCFAEGETADETMQALERAAESWIEAALEQGQEIPSPFINHGYGGKVALRLPRSIHRKAAQFAARDGTSLNQHLLSCIAGGIGASELYTRLANQLTETITKRIDSYLNQAEENLRTAANRITNIVFVSNQVGIPLLFGQPQEMLRNVRLHGLDETAATDKEMKLGGGVLHG
jgi:predicted RNase H-like HicB family nuclease